MATKGEEQRRSIELELMMSVPVSLTVEVAPCTVVVKDAWIELDRDQLISEAREKLVWDLLLVSQVATKLLEPTS